MRRTALLRRVVASGVAGTALALASGACDPGSNEPEGASSSSSTPVATTTASPGTGFDDRQEVAGYTIARVPAPRGATLPEGVGDVATYDIATGSGAPVARYLRITPAGGARANDTTVQSLLADLAGAHGGGTPVQTTIAGFPSWEVSGTDGTVGIARASEDGPVVVFLGTDRVAVETMIDAVSAALDTPP